MSLFSTLELERRKRIRAALFAYAYEMHDAPMVNDDTFDMLCLSIDLNTGTDRPDLDVWFINNFEPFTGQWIHQHPELDKLEKLYQRLTQ